MDREGLWTGHITAVRAERQTPEAFLDFFLQLQDLKLKAGGQGLGAQSLSPSWGAGTGPQEGLRGWACLCPQPQGWGLGQGRGMGLEPRTETSHFLSEPRLMPQRRAVVV